MLALLQPAQTQLQPLLQRVVPALTSLSECRGYAVVQPDQGSSKTKGSSRRRGATAAAGTQEQGSSSEKSASLHVTEAMSASQIPTPSRGSSSRASKSADAAKRGALDDTMKRLNKSLG